VRRAKANLQSAQFGFGTGKAYVNMNRREFFPKRGWWWLGYSPEGPSDKAVAVLKFTDLSGKLIALFINYPDAKTEGGIWGSGRKSRSVGRVRSLSGPVVRREIRIQLRWIGAKTSLWWMVWEGFWEKSPYGWPTTLLQ
jgi:hypothetical protein